MLPAMRGDELAALLGEQARYYRARAGEYDQTHRLDPAHDADARGALEAELRAFAPRGRVLELACGTGQWTGVLAAYADELTAVDASPETLAINRARVERPDVRYLCADLFRWRPERRYDVVFFAFWLSHVPPQRFAAFWGLVANCLAPGGRVFCIDELPASAAHEHPLGRQPAPVVQRRLTDGQRYRIVKVFHQPAALQHQLATLGFSATVHAVGPRDFTATAHQQPRREARADTSHQHASKGRGPPT